jgi:hypothetical protein
MLRSKQEYRRAFNIMKIIIKILIVTCAVLWIWEHINYYLTVKDKSMIDSLYIHFEGYIREGNYVKAYKFMSPSFKDSHDLESFTHLFSAIQEDEAYRLHPQRSLYFTGSKAWLFPKDISIRSNRHGATFELEKIEGKWYFTGNIAIYRD